MVFNEDQFYGNFLIKVQEYFIVIQFCFCSSQKSPIFRYPSDGEERSKASGNVSDQDVVRQTGKMSKPRQQSRQSGVSGCTCQPSLGFFTR